MQRTMGMLLVALAAGLATGSQVAEAAAPKVAGKYAVLQWHICQTVVVAPKSVVSKVGTPITVPGIGGIVKATGMFLTDLNGGKNSAVTNVSPTSTVDFVTVVNTSNVSAVTGVQGNWNAATPTGASGMISMSVGVVTFPASAVSSGTASMSNIEVLGHSTRFPGDSPNGSAIGRHVNSAQQANFSLTDTTATLGGMTWDMSAGNIVNGVAHTINLLRRPGPNEYCIDSSTLTKQ